MRLAQLSRSRPAVPRIRIIGQVRAHRRSAVSSLGGGRGPGAGPLSENAIIGSTVFLSHKLRKTHSRPKAERHASTEFVH